MSVPKFNKTADQTIRIAGAGPSGLVSAIILRQRGYDVEVYEAKDSVGSRWKKGFQIIENFSEELGIMEFFEKHGIKTNFDMTPIHDVMLWDGRKRKADFHSKTPLGYYVMRGSIPGRLDYGLLQQALELGVRVQFGCSKKASDVTINATGPKRVDGMGKEVTFSTPLSDRMIVILDPELAPGGYAYLFICKGEATLGIAVINAYKRIDEHFNQVVKRFKELEDIKIENGEEAYLYANFFLRESLMSNGSVFSGESGGFQDYLFGFGIRYALQSAALAAESIYTNSSYDKLWRSRLGGKLKVGLWNRYMYEKCQSWLPKYFIWMGERSGDFRNYLKGWYRAGFIKQSMANWIQKNWRSRDIGYLKFQQADSLLSFDRLNGNTVTRGSKINQSNEITTSNLTLEQESH